MSGFAWVSWVASIASTEEVIGMTDKAEFESVAAYSRRMGVSEWTVREWIKKGRVRAEQPAGRNGSYRIPVERLAEAG